jgi:hypothetical protein
LNGIEIFDPTALTFSSLPTPYPGFSGYGNSAVLLPNGLIHESDGASSVTNIPVLYDFSKNACYGPANPSSTAGDYDSMTLLQDGSILFAGSLMAARFDSQPLLTIQPAIGSTNAGVPRNLSVAGPDSGSVIWSTSGGTIIQDGTFFSMTPGLFAVTATTSTGITSSAWISVYLPYPGGKAYLNVGVPMGLSAHALNISDQRLVWSVQEGAAAGTVTADGIFTAASAGT